MVEEGKVEYTPTTTQRFEISPDQFSQERKNTLLETFDILKKEVSFFAGISLYGSLSKGKVLTNETAAKTDIDFVIFLDKDEFWKNIDQFKEENNNFAKILESNLLNPRIQDTKTSQSEIEILNTELAAEDFIKSRIQEIFSKNHNGIKLAMIADFISIKDGTSVFRNLEQHDEVISQFDNLIKRADKRWYSGFGPLFMLDVGGGLIKYRNAFFERLAQEPTEKADTLWHIVDRHIRSWERKKDIPTGLKSSYPKTAVEAIKYYISGGHSVVK